MKSDYTNLVIQTYLSEFEDVLKKIKQDELFKQYIHQAVETMINCIREGGRLLLCGNGGSAADAQHIAAELTGRFKYNRAPIDAEALHCNSSFMTAVANDFSFEEVYERAVTAKGRKGDVLIAISTSGNSPNVVRAAQAAYKLQMHVIGMTGLAGGKLKEFCNICFCVPSENVPIIQQIHITIGHIICHLLEESVFGSSSS